MDMFLLALGVAVVSPFVFKSLMSVLRDLNIVKTKHNTMSSVPIRTPVSEKSKLVTLNVVRAASKGGVTQRKDTRVLSSSTDIDSIIEAHMDLDMSKCKTCTTCRCRDCVKPSSACAACICLNCTDKRAVEQDAKDCGGCAKSSSCAACDGRTRSGHRCNCKNCDCVTCVKKNCRCRCCNKEHSCRNRSCKPVYL